MEAKDTVMKPANFEDTRDIHSLLLAQAEISFKAGQEKGYLLGLHSGIYDGRREVVEWIKEHPKKNSVDGFGTTAGYNFYFGKYDWQAKLKEWKIKLP